MPQPPTVTDARPLLSLREVAAVAGVSVKTVYREVQRGALPARQVGRRLRIDPAELGRYLKSDNGLP